MEQKPTRTQQGATERLEGAGGKPAPSGAYPFAILLLMIIGVVGTFASGKDTVAEYIAAKLEYLHISTGDLIRRYIRENNLGDIDRDNMLVIGNKLRSEKGSGFLVESSIKKYKDNLVLSGIRSPGEAEAVQKSGGIIVAVDAPVEQRYEWAKARGRIGDDITPEYFRRQETAEENDDDPNKQQLTTVISMAEFDVANDGTLDDLHAQIDDVLKRLTKNQEEK